MPDRSLPPYRAQLALLVDEAPEGEGWIHEVKFDGYRIGASVAGGKATLTSRNGKDWTAHYPEIAAEVARLPVRAALLDGEVAVELPDGRTSFQALQNASGGGRSGLVYFVFDLLHLDGESLASRPLLERKAMLERLLRRARLPRLRFSGHVEGDGALVHREACRKGLEGIVSKRADAPYRPGRNGAWVKVKCQLRQELVIGGFTDPAGAARDAIGALLVGYREGNALRFAGKVGTGFTNASARALRARFAPLEVREPPFSPAPEGLLGRNAHWVRPELVAEVQFTEWTEDGSLRHPSFQGLRTDKRAAEVVREMPRRAADVAGTGDGDATSNASASPTSTSTANPTATATRPRTPPRPRARSKTPRSPRA